MPRSPRILLRQSSLADISNLVEDGMPARDTKQVGADADDVAFIQSALASFNRRLTRQVGWVEWVRSIT